MKQIKKTKEPQSFSEWKAKANSDWKPAWENLQNPEKVDILEKLIEDQHGICCYCEARISVESAHIEHIVPRSIDIRKRLSFSNLLASCQKETQKGDPLTCGKSRGDWYDKDFYLNPCDENSRKEIIYLLDGNVTVQNKNFKIFIEKINLNIESKKRARSNVIDIFTDLDTSDAQKILDVWLSEKVYHPYISAALTAAKELCGIEY